MNKWPEIPLGAVLKERREKPPLDQLMLGEVPIIEKISFTDGRIYLREDGQTKTNMILIRPGDLVISGINAAKGAIAVYGLENTKPVAATIHYGAYIPDETKVDVRFLWWLLRSEVFQNVLKRQLPGGVKTELKAKRLLPIRIPLPPLEEQRRIVGSIENIVKIIERSIVLRTDANQHVQHLLAVVTDRLIAQATQEFRPLASFLREKLRNGLSIPASQIGSEGILFAKVGIVNSGIFAPSETKYVNISLADDSPYWMEQGDIFVSRGNSLELVGRAALYKGAPERCAFPDLLIRVRVNTEKIDPQFLVYYFQSRAARQYIESVATGTSPSMKKISQPKLMKMPIPVLKLRRQRRIVAYLDELQARVDALRALQAETQAELDALLPSVLDKAFLGAL